VRNTSPTLRCSLLALAAAVLLPAGAAASGLETLYSSSVRKATDGSPLLTVGLMEGRSSVEISGISAFRAESLVGNGVNLPAGTSVTLVPVGARPARVRTWVEVASASPEQKQYVKKTLAAWRAKGFEPRAYLRGGWIDLGQNRIDTRGFALVLEGFERRGDAQRAAARLYREHGVRATFHEELLELPGGRVRARDAAGKTLLEADGAVRLIPRGNAPLRVKGVEYGKGYAWHGFEDREFRGTLAVALGADGKLAVVNEVSTEQWLEGTVPSEIFSTAPAAALRAQACAARSEALAKLATRHLASPFVMCASQHCQVYGGVTKAKKTTSQAVADTRGQVLMGEGDRLVDAVYCAVAGGFTENNDAAWAVASNKHLRGRPDGPVEEPAWEPYRAGLTDANLRGFLGHPPPNWEERSSFLKRKTFRWQKRLTTEEVDRLVAARHEGVGAVQEIAVLERGISGRATLLKIRGDRRTVVIQRELPIRRLFGNLRSAQFVLDTEAGPNGRPAAWIFTGGGWGHGVGMSQIGAIGRAEGGQGYRTILEHYYRGARVTTLY